MGSDPVVLGLIIVIGLIFLPSGIYTIWAAIHDMQDSDDGD